MNCNIIFISILFVACNSGTGEPQPVDSIVTRSREIINADSSALKVPIEKNGRKPFSNQRFREVTVTRIDTGKYEVRGKAQMFEANFEWAVNTDGKEIKSGYGTTDAGAPAWGNFDLIIELEKEYLSAPMTLILFESSAKDGSRQHQLEIDLD